MADGQGRLILVRHGESEGNRARTFTATPEVPITDVGREQAAAAAEWIAARYRPAHVVTSPYRRALQTAEILAGRLTLPVAVEEDLRERSYGTLAGQPYAMVREVAAYDPLEYWRWCPPGGETFDAVVARAGSALDRIARATGAADVVVVSHGGVMLALWRHVTGSWREGRVARNAGIFLVEHRAGRYLGVSAVDQG